MPSQESIQHKRVLDAVLADLATLRSNFGTLLAQLDGDAGITEITYVADNALDAAELES